MTIVDPNTSHSEISDEVLISEFHNPVKYKKAHLYSIMANRADSNSTIKKLLIDFILNEKNRSEYFLGTIIHAWLPVLHILEHGTDKLKLELREVLMQWTKDEKELFVNYIKKDQEYYCLLYDIVDRSEEE